MPSGSRLLLNFSAAALHAAYTEGLDLEDILTARSAFAIEGFPGEAKRGSRRFHVSDPQSVARYWI